MGYVMNKKSIVITAIIVIVAAMIILYATGTYPPDDSKKAAGSIGKVEKQHDANIESKDIQLRSDFIESDDKIRRLVRDLTIYNITLNRLSFILGDIKYDQFCGKLPENNGNICDKLIDLKQFVDNSNEKIAKTIVSVAGAYENDNPPTSDIENQMIQVADFHNQFLKKNDVLNDVIADLDRIINDPAKSKSIDNINEVTKLRDILLLTNLDIAAKIGDKDNIEFATNHSIKNKNIIEDISKGKIGSGANFDLFNNLSSVYSNEDLNIFGSQENDLGVYLSQGILSQEDLNVVMADGGQNKSMSQDGMQIISYAGSKLNLILVNEKGLESVMSSGQLNDIIIPKVVMSNEDLNVYNNEQLNLIVIPPATLNAILFSQDDLGFLSQEDLNTFMSNGDLSVFSGEKLNVIILGGFSDLNSSLAFVFSSGKL